MSDIVDQPPPVVSKHPASWDLVIDHVMALRWDDDNASAIGPIGQTKRVRDLIISDMRERDRIGKEHYGVRLQAGNGRRHLIDAYQELLDFIVYLATWLEEHGIKPTTMRHFGDLPQPEMVGARIVITFMFESIHKAAVLRELIDRGQ